MNKNSWSNKPRLSNSFFFDLAVERIKSCKKKNVEIIGFKKVFHKLGSSFQIERPQIWKLLYLLQEKERIRIVAGHGIVLKEKSGGKNEAEKE